MGKPACLKCGEDRNVEHVDGLVWYCNTCGTTFGAKPAEPAGLHRPRPEER